MMSSIFTSTLYLNLYHSWIYMYLLHSSDYTMRSSILYMNTQCVNVTRSPYISKGDENTDRGVDPVYFVAHVATTCHVIANGFHGILDVLVYIYGMDMLNMLPTLEQMLGMYIQDICSIL